MDYFQPYCLPADETILAAWESQAAALADSPSLTNALARQSNLFPRFAAAYAQLKALPRGARRTLQRRLAEVRDLAEIAPELRRKLAHSLAGAALLLALAQGADAATITVTTNIPDINDGDGKCSLIEAMINANDDAATHPDCAAGNGADTIMLPKGSTHTLTKYYTDYFGYTGLPVINSTITIEGNGSTITRKSDAPLFRFIATYYYQGDLTLKNITLTGASLYSSTEPSGGYWGGAIYNPYGKLTIINCTISANKAGGGGGLYNGGTATVENSTISGNIAYQVYRNGAGGGVSNTGTLTINNSRILNNTAATNEYYNWTAGGGILNYREGILYINNSTISGNKAAGFYADDDGWGGGIYNNQYGVLAINSSTISGNRAGYGGGIYIYNWSGGGTPRSTINSSTISGNIAKRYGGGIYTSGTLDIQNSTISGNTVKGTSEYPGYGGGIYNTDTISITSSTISGNSGDYGGGIFNRGIAVIGRSLISGNKASHGSEISNRFQTQADNFNVFGNNGNSRIEGFTPGPTDIVPKQKLDNILGPLKNNGGPTLTHALPKGSPAIDAAPADADCPATDQRGVARPQGAGCDIGAVESGGKPAAVRR